MDKVDSSQKNNRPVEHEGMPSLTVVKNLDRRAAARAITCRWLGKSKVDNIQCRQGVK